MDESSFFSLVATQNVRGQLKVQLDDPQGFALLFEVGADGGGARVLEEASHDVMRAQHRADAWEAIGMHTTPQLFSPLLSSTNSRPQRRAMHTTPQLFSPLLSSTNSRPQ